MHFKLHMKCTAFSQIFIAGIKGIIQSGLASAGKDALMYGALNILSTGTGMAVTKIAGI